MSTSRHVCGIKPADEKYKQMKVVYDACTVVGIEIPGEVYDFFNGNEPDPNGVVVSPLPDFCLTPFNENGSAGFYIDVPNLPKDVTIIKFWNSW